MANYTQTLITAGLLCLLVACGGGGGGDRSPGVEPGPPPPGGPVTPPPPTLPSPVGYAEAAELFAFVTAASIPEDGRAVVDFQLTDGNNVAILDLELSNLRFVLAKLQASPLGNTTGSWQSYINQIEEAGAVGTGTEDKLQATYEREGEFTNNGDGSYRYRYATDVNNLDPAWMAQAELEGLNLGYEPDRTHRVAIQFDGNPNDTANPWYDFVPATGTTSNVFNMDIAATANCNRCHDPLGIHGGNRREVAYCVTCHNPGSTDANSGNTVDMKTMIHKIHAGANLPSVQEGGRYVIYGFRNSEHDYSNLHYPQDTRNCVNCHAGTATGAGLEDTLVLTAQGDNWAQIPSKAACGSCHDTSRHVQGQDEMACASCHQEGGIAGSIADSHLIPVQEARKAFAATIEDVTNTQPGEFPTVTYRISNPNTGEDYDVKNDPLFLGGIRVGTSWSSRDFHNTGNGSSENASQVQTDAVGAAVDNGDGSFSVTMPVAIPDGDLPPGVAATGSGMASIEGHPSVEIEGEATNVPLGDANRYFSIDEPDGQAVERRVSVTIQQCNACHQTLVLHGSNRSDNIDTCASCHNPRNTDLRQRLRAMDPPTDGKDEESIDFKTMVHGIHAAAIREQPLEVVGFGGFNTYRYNTDAVHYPGDLANCTACHTDDGYRLPLADGVLGTTIDTGNDIASRLDDTVVTPQAAVCSSCHDSAISKAHMETTGGASFSTTQFAIDNQDVVETCSVCHNGEQEHHPR